MRDYLYYFGQIIAAVDTNTHQLSLVGDYVFSGVNDIHFKGELVNIGTLVKEAKLRKLYKLHAVSLKRDNPNGRLKHISYTKNANIDFDEPKLATDEFTTRWIRYSRPKSPPIITPTERWILDNMPTKMPTQTSENVDELIDSLERYQPEYDNKQYIIGEVTQMLEKKTGDEKRKLQDAFSKWTRKMMGIVDEPKD